MNIRPGRDGTINRGLPTPAVLAWLFAGLCGLPAVWNSHWMWIDDQMIVGSQLWPPDSVVNREYHAMGREYVAHGLYFKLLSFVLPLRPFWYYLVNYLMHLSVVALAGWVVWRATRSRLAITLAVLTVGFASTGPEVFLTLMKLELPMMLWLLISLVLLQQLLQGARGRLLGGLPALVVTTFLSGTLGKETFVILPVGLIAALIATAMTDLRSPMLRRLLAAVCATCLGVAAVYFERVLLGVRSIANGSYTGKLLVVHPTLATVLGRANIYTYVAGDAVLLTVASAVLCIACIVSVAFRRRGLSAAQLVAITCAAAASSQVAFNIVFLDFVTVYYLYPAAILGAVALGCLWPAEASGPRRMRQTGRAGLTVILAGTTLLTLPTFALRLYAQNAIPSMEWHLIRAIAATPPNSLVLLAFPPGAEMIGNTPVLVQHALGRNSLDVRSALGPDTAARLARAQAAHRPVFLAFVYDFGENWKVGVRGVAQKTRKETLALVARHGIEHICPDRGGNLGPWSLTISRVPLGWSPLLHIRFGYGWELDRLPASSGAGSGCGSG
ncbi:MAG: hypothetical protein HIU82_10230 [Proteobacteria bacterium]|nr:hypothetical protein [Pseudomonadota bacterium]